MTFLARNRIRVNHFLKVLLVAILINAGSAIPTLAQQVGQPYKISGITTGLGDVRSYRISADNQRVVFTADAIIDEKIELFSVPIGGGARVKLNGSITGNRDVTSFQITPDSAHVVFIADSLTDEKRELFIVPIQGGSITRLNSATMPADADVVSVKFAFSSQSKKIVFLDREQISASPRHDNFNLFSVDVNGSNLAKINFPNTRPNREAVRNFAVSPNGLNVAFISTSGTGFDDAELFTVGVNGTSPPLKLSADIGVNNFGDVYTFLLEYSPSGVHLLYSQAFNSRSQLFSVPALGGTPIRLQNVDDNIETRSVKISSDSQTVIYVLGGLFDGDIYSVPLTGGVPIFLDSTNDADSISIVASNSLVLYPVDTALQNISALRSIPITGGTPQAIDEPGGSSRPAGTLSPNGQFIVHQGRVNLGSVFNARFELRSVPLSGGAAGKVLSERAGSFSILPDSQNVIYLRQTINANDDRISNLSIVGINGGDENDLSGTLPFMSSLSSFILTPNSRFVVFRADKDIFDKDELYVVELPITPNEEICVPIKAKNDKIVVICL